MLRNIACLNSLQALIQPLPCCTAAGHSGLRCCDQRWRKQFEQLWPGVHHLPCHHGNRGRIHVQVLHVDRHPGVKPLLAAARSQERAKALPARGATCTGARCWCRSECAPSWSETAGGHAASRPACNRSPVLIRQKVRHITDAHARRHRAAAHEATQASTLRSQAVMSMANSAAFGTSFAASISSNNCSQKAKYTPSLSK